MHVEMYKTHGPPLSAMAHLDWMTSRLAGHELALFLDYDGTLTPIVDRPEQAILSDDMRSLLARLATRCTLAMVSGRDPPGRAGHGRA